MTANVNPQDAQIGAQPLDGAAAAGPGKAKAKKPAGRAVDEAQLPLIQEAVNRSFPGKGEVVDGGDAFLTEVLPLFNQKREDYLSLARRIAHMLYARLKRPITVDDVRAVAPPPPEFDGRVMGAIFLTREWENVGYEKSPRKTCHRRPVALFVLAPL